MKAWYTGLNPREQRLVLIAAGVVGAFLLYLLIQPLAAGVERMEDKVAALQKELQWMEQSAQEVQRLRRAGQAGRSLQGQSLLGLIEATARRSQLGGAVKKVQPDGQTGVRVWLEQASFDDLMLWLDELRARHGVSITDISVERQRDPGLVNARLQLEAHAT